MSSTKDTKKAIYSDSISSHEILSEWRFVNSDDIYTERMQITRGCPFDAQTLKLIIGHKTRLFITGIIGVLLGFSGIHFLLVRHWKKGFIRLGLLLGVIVLLQVCSRFFDTNIFTIVAIICGMLEVWLFVFGFEEGMFLCRLALYDVRMASRRRINGFLSLKIGRLSIKMLITILLVVVFIAAMIWVYINYR